MDPGDREILILRIDRRLAWWDLAITSLGEDAAVGDLALESRRIRERFGQIRRHIFRAAVQKRLLEPPR
jgi:hypothetical protein